MPSNGLGIYEGRKIMEQKFSFALPFNRNPVAEIMTFSPPFINTMLAVRCYSRVFFYS